jgi:NAD(P)H dehydrogenase (quinone)
MPKVLVLYHSTYGHVEKMAEAIAEGARQVDGAQVDIKRVPELVPEELAKKSGYKLDQAAPIATIDELSDYDAIIIGAGTRFGTAASQLRNFLDQTGGLWASGAFTGKVGSAFTSTASQHGAQETTLIGMLQTLLHPGMVVAGLPDAWQGQLRIDEMTGGSPYGATTITGGDGSRMPSDNELEGARWQGRYVAETAKKLPGGRS